MSSCQIVRGVPVVADVVVVEDHRRRHGRQQPAVGRVGPRQSVEVGVLLVVAELGARWLVDVAPRIDERPHLRRGLVGIDLVAEEQHQVRPPNVCSRVGVVRVGAIGDPRHAERVGAQGVDRRGTRCRPRRGTPTYGRSRSRAGVACRGRASAPRSRDRPCRTAATRSRRHTPRCRGTSSPSPDPPGTPARSGARGPRRCEPRRCARRAVTVTSAGSAVSTQIAALVSSTWRSSGPSTRSVTRSTLRRGVCRPARESRRTCTRPARRARVSRPGAREHASRAAR